MNKERRKLIEEMIEFCEFYQEYMEEFGLHEQPRFSFKVELQSDKPIVVIFSSDVHFGSIYTDYRKLKEILKNVFENERVYLVVNGDYVDNFQLPVPKLLLAGIDSQIISPAKQREWYKALLEYLVIEKRKLLAVNIGNHEEFSGENEFIEILRKNEVPFGLNRMLLELKINNDIYRIALIHKSLFNSVINPMHSALRELQLNFSFADVVITSHTHLPSLAIMPFPDENGMKERILIRTGTLKNVDKYTYKYFNPYPVSDISTPAIVFANKRMIPFFRFEDALQFIKNF